MSAADFCCTHPQQRIDSPEPPARPLAVIDGIFAAAALPEDHPDALNLPHRKPETDSSIVRSPGIASKIKMQFRRKSMKSLSKEKEYDEDAHRITSQEVLHEISADDEVGVQSDTVQEHRFGSATDLGPNLSPSSDAGTPQIRTSILGSLEYLRPLIQRPSDLTISESRQNLTNIAVRVATRQHLEAIFSENDRPLPPLLKSFSSPLLPSDEGITVLQTRRSRSEYDLGNTLSLPKLRHSKSSGVTSEVPKLHVQEPMDVGGDQPQKSSGENEAEEIAPARGPTPSEGGVHLHKMDITQQLRCMSQLSDVAEDDTPITSPHPWNFHMRERSDVDASGRSRHSRQKSSTGVDSATLPSSWGRVWSPIRDTSSSIYSRPTSAGANAMDQQPPMPNVKQVENAVDLDALFADWPLRPTPSTEEVNRGLSTVSQKSAASERGNKPLPPTPGGNGQVSAKNDDGSSVKWLSPPRRTDSISNKSVSSNASKVSKFVERFSPLKKSVRKRRSMFRFLRPGSRKQQSRSISTPTLSAKSPGQTATYDGPSDDPALLTVQYELPNQPSIASRSVSMSHLCQSQHTDTASQLTVQHPLQRRPTLADYERNLSVVGDDRRRPSVVNPHRMKDIQEEDRRESIPLRRQLSRAHALKDDASPLMAQALEKHQQEKALFRSASKQRESLKSSQPTPTLATSLFDREDSDLRSSSIDEHGESLQLPSKGNAARSSRRSISSTALALPQPPTAVSSLHLSTVAVEPALSTKSAGGKNKLPVSPSQKPRIGTSLDSWSRYPSHTRAERCGPAGLSDAVITRDFAVDIDPEEIHITDEIEPGSPTSKKSEKMKSKKAKASLPKSRSMTLNSIVRYYSNLFHTSGSTGQNRRTSVSTGGRLSYPELEMLPPPSAESSTHRHAHWDPFERLKDDAQKIKEYVKDEEDKIEGYVKKEEDKLEHFVRDEEDKFEGFMKKEEQKIMTYVKEEEDKLLHHHRHHSGEHQSTGRESPFQEIGFFGVTRESSEHNRRRDTMIGPMDDLVPLEHTQSNEVIEFGMALDGSPSTATEDEAKSPSKADLWSGIYQECITEPPTPAIEVVAEAEQVTSRRESAVISMPPPMLKPIKPRSPEQPKQLDPKATIRRFPSVTVIDDCKGHFRSVSLISVKTNKSAKFERSSTHDLLELIQLRERQEREKLLRPVKSELPIEKVSEN